MNTYHLSRKEDRLKKLAILLFSLLLTCTLTGIVFANTVVFTDSTDSVTGVNFHDFALATADTLTINILAYENNTHDFFGNGAGNDFLDTSVWLFTLGGAIVGHNDDSWESWFSGSQTDGSIDPKDSYWNGPVDAGYYRLAIGSYYLTEVEAWAGYNINGETKGNYQLTLTAENNDLILVPIPATIILLSTGLVSLAGLRRKFKK